jgi:hypothetical protein
MKILLINQGSGGMPSLSGTRSGPGAPVGLQNIIFNNQKVSPVHPRSPGALHGVTIFFRGYPPSQIPGEGVPFFKHVPARVIHVTNSDSIRSIFIVAKLVLK